METKKKGGMKCKKELFDPFVAFNPWIDLS